MREIAFKWPGLTSIADEVKRPLSRISLELEPHGRPMRATLWRVDGTGLCIESEMHDIKDRIEVGVLSFDIVSKPKAGEKMVDLDPTFCRDLRVMKLVVNESECRADSGLLICSDSNQEILIIAGSHPYFLAVHGVLSGPHIFEPEYPLERYETIELS